MRGSKYIDNNKCDFLVWAPEKDEMLLHIVSPREQKIKMEKDEWGYFHATIEESAPVIKYFFIPDGQNGWPDPASHYQPEGVHGPSQVINHNTYEWRDKEWKGIPFRDLILYELHVGTFTNGGTFEGIISKLNNLTEIGINAIEIMPVSQFPGNRNWGYDGTFPYAVQNSYGGPEGLKRLVDACHEKGIAVFLDVVYNHLGPEGNYLSKYGPYFTKTYRTPWGEAINLDEDWSDGVREYFCENMLYWFEYYHIDGLRVDAVHTMYDNSAVHFWEYAHERIKDLEQRLGRQLHLVAEADFNSPHTTKPPEARGLGFTAQWLDDFHHALYVILDKKGGKERYEDFGSTQQLAKAYTDGFVHSGEYVKFRRRKHGRSSAGVPGDQFVAFNQNHDQVGNRVKGERLSALVDLDRQKLAAAALILSPYVPMLFMGEEFAAPNPFFYFVSHTDSDLVKAVKEGRKKEFEKYKWGIDPPDPIDEKTFIDSKIDWSKRDIGVHRIMLQWHKELIALRNGSDILRDYDKNNIRAYPVDEKGLALQRQSHDGMRQLLIFFNFSEEHFAYRVPSGAWKKLVDSHDSQWLEHNETKELLPATMGEQELAIPPLNIAVYSNH